MPPSCAKVVSHCMCAVVSFTRLIPRGHAYSSWLRRWQHELRQCVSTAAGSARLMQAPVAIDRAASAGLPRVARLWTDYFLHYGFDIWVTPTTPAPATPINETEPWSLVRMPLQLLMLQQQSSCAHGNKRLKSKVQLTRLHHVLQIDGKLLWHESVHCRFNSIDPPIRVPSISLPAGVTASGLPVGLQLQGTPGAASALHRWY